MVFTLIFALISTFFYINVILTEIFNTRIIHLTIDSERSPKNNENNNILPLIKIVLIILMGIFWGITIRFW
jgi:NADH:ubiquinone oxidoreductase subunit 2 (subunit N)